VLGKHNIGTMSATNTDASAPMGIDTLPRFHGPGRNRLPTKKTRMNIGMVNALQNTVSYNPLKTFKRYSHKCSYGTDTEQCANSQAATEDK
jgi:hypothetical protein